eukprot:gnl/TRDRNA2_/TRDRNA2_151349_c0_seq1.p1 gnl/TRDRNA2_/TRDRNA2_151349_c0~~gnl/TRDRNA2_/TRDRNA2_151349_c0_seq1.p1  ORF type:complete len:575 (-),score=154.49 gnl/TRDRNA2_/TRDRNA2_151349_c0_seq1:139-1863(-)
MAVSRAPADAVEELPKGVKKEIVAAAAPGEERIPKQGDECTVHYVGRFATGDEEEFDNSRNRGEPIRFTLGAGQVVKGWDLAVATMRWGEVAKFTCAPQFAYGDQGAPPKIPGGATLVFEIELVSFCSEDDLFEDGGVIRTKVQEGSSLRKPDDDSEVLCSIKASSANGTVVDDRSNLSYVIGSDALGPLSRAVDKALGAMKKGECVSLRCSKEYAYNDPSHGDYVTIELALHDIIEIIDVSPKGDKSIIKRQLVEGSGYYKPREGGSVRLMVEAVTDAKGDSLPRFVGRTELLFVVGDGEVCDAVEYAATNMKECERAIVECSDLLACAEPKLGLGDIASTVDGKVFLTMMLDEFENCKACWEMSWDEKLEFAQKRKEVGSRLFKAQRYRHALERYKKAACQLKLGDHYGARNACTSVLDSEPDNVKALFRRASACIAVHEWPEATADLRRLLELEPENKEAQRLLPQAIRGAKQEEKKYNSVFSKMSKAFNGLADDEERRAKEKKEAHEASIARKGAAAREEAKVQRQKSEAEVKEDFMRANQSMMEMQRKVRQMEMKRWEEQAGIFRDDDE